VSREVRMKKQGGVGGEEKRQGEEGGVRGRTEGKEEEKAKEGKEEEGRGEKAKGECKREEKGGGPTHGERAIGVKGTRGESQVEKETLHPVQKTKNSSEQRRLRTWNTNRVGKCEEGGGGGMAEAMLRYQNYEGKRISHNKPSEK